MPQAATHILIPLVLADIYRDYIANKRFNLRYVLIAGLAGILPDIDVLLAWTINLYTYVPFSDIHRTFTHTLTFPAIFFALFFVTKNYNLKFLRKQKLKLNYVFLTLSFGTLMHLVLDFSFNSLPVNYFQGTFFAGLDAILLTLWLIHEELRHRISDYI